MKVKILNKEHFTTKPNQYLSTLENSHDVTITLPRRKLVFKHKDIEIAKYESEHSIEIAEYEDRLIGYLQEGKVKRISFEVFGNPAQLKEVKQLINQRNNVVNYKSPLFKDCSIKIQESMLIDKNRNVDFKGFVHVILIFTCLNYIRLVIESKTEERLVFIENVY